MDQQLFDETILRKLERLELVASKIRAGAIKGERRSVKRGTSMEFADYRNYAPGDDLRRIDWNAYARLEKPFLKLFEEEEDLAVHVIVDASASMEWPVKSDDVLDVDEAHHKFRYALRLAGGLAHIGLTGSDRVAVTLLRGDTIAERWGPARGRGKTLNLLPWLETQKTGGETNLDKALADYALRDKRGGLVIVVSDMFSPSGYIDGLAALQARGSEVALMHVLSPEEMEPPVMGDLKLVDVETGLGEDVTIDGAMRGLYRRRLQEWRADIARTCSSRDVRYLPILTDTPWEQVVLFELRRAGLAR